MDFSYAAAQHGVIGALPILPLEDPRDRLPKAAVAATDEAADVLAIETTEDASGVSGSGGLAGVPASENLTGGVLMPSGSTATLVSPAEAADRAGALDDAAAAMEESRPDWLTDADEGLRADLAMTSPQTSLGSRVRRSARTVVRFWHSLDRRPAMLWVKRIVLLPIGERFALISLMAAFTTPRLTFVALLSWGGFALVYGLTGRALRSVAM
jgi:hypothetical protein